MVVPAPPPTLNIAALCAVLCMTMPCAPTEAREVQPASITVSANLIGIGAIDCTNGPAGVRTVVGAAVGATADTFTLDTRSPLADGSAEPQGFHVTAPGFVGFDHYLLPGGFVRVTFEVRRDAGCALRILIESVAQWHGVPNPIKPTWFFAANHRVLEPFAAAPFTVRPSRASCTRLDVTASSDGKPLEPRIVTAPASSACTDSKAWSYWVASPPLR